MWGISNCVFRHRRFNVTIRFRVPYAHTAFTSRVIVLCARIASFFRQRQFPFAGRWRVSSFPMSVFSLSAPCMANWWRTMLGYFVACVIVLKLCCGDILLLGLEISAVALLRIILKFTCCYFRRPRFITFKFWTFDFKPVNLLTAILNDVVSD